ncbi:PTR2-domain-containing protein [Tothia fuscella]|uniref:PTR2-domain-containing protein n=1 Tax=Tothia fuscella TaxID=1048955 RepID=A0A9P4P0U4_9PEZI|nr:PTR2-domain-containing protein [Tothia fuscella]
MAEWDHELYPPPTEDDKIQLRKIAGEIPWIGYSLCVVEFAERASYYGAVQVFANFLQKPLPKGGNGAGAPPKGTQLSAGALGKGLQFGNAFVLLFRFMAYALPIFGAWIGDTKIGRYPAILLGVLICGIAHIIQVVGALPSVLQAGHGLAPFLISLFILAIGAGIFKPNILPTVLDQYRHQHQFVKTLKTGERVIVDPEMTVNRISLIFYGFVNVGAFFPVATVYAEKRIGFWLAFLLPGIIYFLLPLGLLLTYKKTYRVKPNGTALDDFFNIVRVAFVRNKGKFWKHGFLDAAKPSVLAAEGVTRWGNRDIHWSDELVGDVKRTISACVMFLYFPVWYLNNGGVGSVLTSQGSSMKTNGAPNDLLSNFNALSIIFFAPLLTNVIYPVLERHNMMPGRITRITFGFTLAWISSVIGAITQWYIYKTSPCGHFATDCTIGDGVSPLSVWVQLPNVILGAISECFCQVTAYEIAYARSPKNMKAIVMSIFLFMNALSNALAQIMTPAIKDPNLVWVWASPAIVLFFVTIVFYWRYRYMNSDVFMTEEAVTSDEKPAHLEDGLARAETMGGGSTVRAVDDEKKILEHVDTDGSEDLPHEKKV